MEVLSLSLVFFFFLHSGEDLKKVSDIFDTCIIITVIYKAMNYLKPLFTVLFVAESAF